MTETMSLNQLARESGRSKTELKQPLADGTLIGTQETHGNKRYLIERASAIAAGILPEPTQKPQPRHDGTIDTALRRTIADELEPVIALLTTRTSDIEHTALTAALDRVDTTLLRIETILHEHLLARRQHRWGRLRLWLTG